MIPSAGTCFDRVQHSDFNARNRDSGYQGTAGFHFLFLFPQECGPESGTAGVWQPLDSVLQCFVRYEFTITHGHAGHRIEQA